MASFLCFDDKNDKLCELKKRQMSTRHVFGKISSNNRSDFEISAKYISSRLLFIFFWSANHSYLLKSTDYTVVKKESNMLTS